MSLVLEALRRIDRPDEKVEAISIAMSSRRRARHRAERRVVAPLLLGVFVGLGAILTVEFAGRQGVTTRSVQAGEPARSTKGAAAVPPMALATGIAERHPGPASPLSSAPPAPKDFLSETSTPANAIVGAAPPRSRTLPTPEPDLVLQATSERDGKPIAIINDVVVREGELLGRARIVRIDRDSVEVLRESGKKEVVRFATPPPDPSPSPTH
jgi:hypothetical protein